MEQEIKNTIENIEKTDLNEVVSEDSLVDDITELEGQTIDNNSNNELDQLEDKYKDQIELFDQQKLMYKKLEEEYSNYRFDIELKEDMKNIKSNISDEEIEILKGLKLDGNIKAYNLLVKSKQAEGAPYVDNEGFRHNYSPSSGGSNVNIKSKISFLD